MSLLFAVWCVMFVDRCLLIVVCLFCCGLCIGLHCLFVVCLLVVVCGVLLVVCSVLFCLMCVVCCEL